MAPPERYPSPSKQMLELGRQARAEGLTFEEFWERAVRPGKPALTPRRIGKGIYANLVGAVIWPSDTGERTDAQRAVIECKEAWRRGYDRDPVTPGDRAIAALYAIWSEREVGGIESGDRLPLAAA